MNTIKKLAPGLLVCAGITIPAWFLGNRFPIIGGPIMAILMGMVLCLFITDRTHIVAGINFTSKKILQTAVVLLGFGLDLHVIAKTGLQSLPIIICTIGISLLIAYVLHRLMKASATASMLVGVGSSICGGSAIAATASVIDADDEEIAQAISVIFFFNVIAALVFPPLGHLLGFDTTGGEAFGIFAGTAVNDTSSVTATAATWDSMWHLGTATLNKAVTVKLTRTLAIIPITLVIAFLQTKKMRKEAMTAESTTGNRQRKKSIHRKNFSYVHFILCYCGADNHRCRFFWRFIAGVFTVKRAKQNFHYYGYGSSGFEYKYCETNKDRRKADLYRSLLLGWHHLRQLVDAACHESLVRDDLHRFLLCHFLYNEIVCNSSVTFSTACCNSWVVRKAMVFTKEEVSFW